MNCKAFVGTALVTGFLLGGAAAQASDDPPKPDNTAVNTEDRGSNLATPANQSNNSTAIEVTANIRRAVVGDKSLSTSAHNVKIITKGNVVTLRGPVASSAEKERIDALARQYAAGKDVNNLLSVNGA